MKKGLLLLLLILISVSESFAQKKVYLVTKSNKAYSYELYNKEYGAPTMLCVQYDNWRGVLDFKDLINEKETIDYFKNRFRFGRNKKISTNENQSDRRGLVCTSLLIDSFQVCLKDDYYIKHFIDSTSVLFKLKSIYDKGQFLEERKPYLGSIAEMCVLALFKNYVNSALNRCHQLFDMDVDCLEGNYWSSSCDENGEHLAVDTNNERFYASNQLNRNKIRLLYTLPDDSGIDFTLSGKEVVLNSTDNTNKYSLQNEKMKCPISLQEMIKIAGSGKVVKHNKLFDIADYYRTLGWDLLDIEIPDRTSIECKVGINMQLTNDFETFFTSLIKKKPHYGMKFQYSLKDYADGTYNFPSIFAILDNSGDIITLKQEAVKMGFKQVGMAKYNDEEFPSFEGKIIADDGLETVVNINFQLRGGSEKERVVLIDLWRNYDEE